MNFYQDDGAIRHNYWSFGKLKTSGQLGVVLTRRHNHPPRHKSISQYRTASRWAHMAHSLSQDFTQ